jgi:hypothetical protein
VQRGGEHATIRRIAVPELHEPVEKCAYEKAVKVASSSSGVTVAVSWLKNPPGVLTTVVVKGSMDVRVRLRRVSPLKF